MLPRDGLGLLKGCTRYYLMILGLGWGETEKIGVWDAVIGKGIQVNIAIMRRWRER